jgi:hypothetical protein
VTVPIFAKVFSVFADKWSMKIDVSPYLSQLQAASAKNQPEDPIQKNTLKAILTRIKYSKLSRSQRAVLSRMLHDLAVNDKLDFKSAKGILDTIFLMEMTAKDPQETKPKAGGLREKTVNEQIDEINSEKADRKAQQEKLDNLGNLFSAKA